MVPLEQANAVVRVSDLSNLREAVGRKVMSLHAFSGVSRGTMGRVEDYYNLFHEGMDVEGIVVDFDLYGRTASEKFERHGLCHEGSLLELVQ
jgi:hypothetical protein